MRERGDPQLKSALRKQIKNVDTLRNKDRMAADPILDLSNPGLLQLLRAVGTVVHTLVPELTRFTTDNNVRMYPHPVDICVEQSGFLYVLDHDPKKRANSCSYRCISLFVLKS